MTKALNLLPNKLLRDKFFNSSGYPGFQKRIISALIDLTLVSIVFLPLFSILSGVIYGDTIPQELIGKAIKDITAIKTNTSQNIDFVTYVKNNPELYDYFYTNHGFLKMFFEQVLQLITLFILFLVFWIKKQATPGKMLMSMKIVDANTLGKPTNKQFYIRILGYIISILPLFLGIFWIAFDSKKQGWHDKLANTLVINVDKKK